MPALFTMKNGTIALSLVIVGGFWLWPAGNKRPVFDDPVTSRLSTSTATETVANASPPESESASWSRFRGPNGSGISDDSNVPLEWNEKKNLAWKLKLPGAGASSPIVTKDYVFVTSYSGYGVPGERGGSSDKLERHLSCVDRKTGKVVWAKTVKNQQREDVYQGMGVPEHGYATNTPVTDGEHIYVFYGKSGVLAYDLKGEKVWEKNVGTESSNRRWGSASSLLLHGNRLIVNASEESQAIFALDKKTGKEIWKTEASSLELAYSTPALVKIDDKRTDLVVAVPSEVWGINPDNGKLVWFVETSLTDNLSPSVNVVGNMIYVFGGYRSKGSLAIKTGGKGDITESHTQWTSRTTSYVATPVHCKNRLYWIDDKGLYHCLDATNGESIVRERMPFESGGRGRPVYSSPISVNDKIYLQTRTNGLYVVDSTEDLEVISHNEFGSDKSQFNSTPAVDNGQLFLRSNQFLYCVQKQAE